VRLLITVAMILCLFCPAIVSGLETITESPLVYASEQKIEGTGFNNAYQNIVGLNISLSNRGHGSGSYSHESELDLMNSAKTDDATSEAKVTSENIIDFKESTDFSSRPTGLNYGKSFKMGGYQSLGLEVTRIWNLAEGTSMDVRFDHIDTLSKSIAANLYWVDKVNSDDEFNRSLTKKGRSNLKIDAAFSGRGHIGALQVKGDVHNADLLVDQDYLGTYSISSNMTMETSDPLEQSVSSFLPCCSGGFSSMDVPDQKAFKSAQGIFDCTCFEPPETS
jgi:hypothetical protein